MSEIEYRNIRDLVLLLVLQDGLQKCTPLVTGRFLVKHACLDDLLVHVELVLGSSEDFLFNTVHSAQAQHPYLVLLPDTMSPVLSLQVLQIEMKEKFKDIISIQELLFINNTITDDKIQLPGLHIMLFNVLYQAITLCSGDFITW